MQKLNALITGGSEGLGKSFAVELGRRNMNLVLVSLPDTGLPELAAFLGKNFEIWVEYYELDLTDTDACIRMFDSLRQKNIRLDVLINNAGIGNFSWFDDAPIHFCKTQIELNVVTPVLLSKLFLEQVSKDSKSYILNVGSMGSLFIVPKKQIYGATKAFLRYFTSSLQLEMKDTQTSISLLSSGGINTKPELLVLHQSLTGISKATILEPEFVAKRAVDGMLNGEKIIVPGFVNRMLMFVNSFLPSFLRRLIVKNRFKEIIEPSVKAA